MSDEDSQLASARRLASLEFEMTEIRALVAMHNPGAFGQIARFIDPKTVDLVREAFEHFAQVATLNASAERDSKRVQELEDELGALRQSLVRECLLCDDIRRTGNASGKCHKHADGSWNCGAVHNGPGWAGPNPDPAPIPMQLWCPLCHTRHIDEGEFATKPHTSHACQNPSCCLVWKPAQVPTVGVYDLPGYLNKKPA